MNTTSIRTFTVKCKICECTDCEVFESTDEYFHEIIVFKCKGCGNREEY